VVSLPQLSSSISRQWKRRKSLQDMRVVLC
jgi:hypothetical protein